MDRRNNYTYACKVLRDVDGDSIVVDVDQGLRSHQELPVRIFGLNAPEMSTAEGKEAARFAASLMPVGSLIVARTYKPGSGDGLEKYGRWLAEVALPDERLLSDVMIQAGFAVPYFGGAR